MPKLTMEIPEVYESITRPVAMKVLDDLLGYMNLSEKPPIVFTGGTGAEKHPGTAIGKDVKKSYIFNSEAKVILEVSEEYPEEFALQQAQLRPEEMVFFSDDALEIWMKPMYQPVACTMSFKVRTDSETGAKQIVQNWKKMVTRGKQDYLHTVTYHYPIPLPMVVILCELHRMREAVAPYGDAVGPYLKAHFSDKMSVLSDQAGKSAYFVIRENQIGIQGWFDFNDSPPTFDKDAEGGSWGVSLTYKFHYDRCEGVMMHYPLMVHNQILDARFYEAEKPFELEDIHQQPNLSRDLFNKFAFNNGTSSAWTGRPGVAIPYVDTWLPNYEFPGCQNLLRILVGIDPADPKAIVTLTELGSWEIQADALAYLHEVGQALFAPGGALFHVGLYKRQTLMPLDNLRIDSDLTISYVDDLQLREVHHLTMSLHYDMQSLTPTALALLAKHGEFAIAAMKLIDPTLEAKGLLPILQADGTIVITELKRSVMAMTAIAAGAANQAVAPRDWFASDQGYPVDGWNSLGQNYSPRYWFDSASTEYKWWLVGQFVIKAYKQE